MKSHHVEQQRSDGPPAIYPHTLTIHSPAHQSTKPAPKCRSLLALDGETLTPDILKSAIEKCRQVSCRVDILLVNPKRPPTTVLHELLIDLEQADIDYRLSSTEGSLSDLVAQHLRRFVGVSLVMVSALPSLGSDWRIKIADLRHQGYQFVSLQDAPLVGVNL